jgi:hypothetical protein
LFIFLKVRIKILQATKIISDVQNIEFLNLDKLAEAQEHGDADEIEKQSGGYSYESNKEHIHNDLEEIHRYLDANSFDNGGTVNIRDEKYARIDESKKIVTEHQKNIKDEDSDEITDEFVLKSRLGHVNPIYDSGSDADWNEIQEIHDEIYDNGESNDDQSVISSTIVVNDDDYEELGLKAIVLSDPTTVTPEVKPFSEIRTNEIYSTEAENSIERLEKKPNSSRYMESRYSYSNLFKDYPTKTDIKITTEMLGIKLRSIHDFHVDKSTPEMDSGPVPNPNPNADTPTAMVSSSVSSITDSIEHSSNDDHYNNYHNNLETDQTPINSEDQQEPPQALHKMPSYSLINPDIIRSTKGVIRDNSELQQSQQSEAGTISKGVEDIFGSMNISSIITTIHTNFKPAFSPLLTSDDHEKLDSDSFFDRIENDRVNSNRYELSKGIHNSSIA